MKESFTIFIDRLAVDASVGVYDFEKQAKQKLIVSLEAKVDIPDTQTLKHGDVVCYDTLSKGIISIIESQHFELLETLARMIIEYCLADIRIKVVDLKLEKPDIIPIAQSVGVCLRAEQP